MTEPRPGVLQTLGRLALAGAAGAMLLQAYRASSMKTAETRASQPASLAHETRATSNAKGRDAESPWAIPGRGWFAVLKRTYSEFSADRLMAVAAGVTFYALLAIFPAIAAFVSLYGLVADRATLAGHLDLLANVMPSGGLDIITEQLTRLTAQKNAALGVGFVSGLGVALWSANAGIKAMFDALNVAYDEEETRSFIRLNAISLTFTAGAILFLLLGLGAVAVVPLVLAYLGLPGLSEGLISVGRWPVLFVMATLGLSILYRYGPSRADAKWRWITPGSVIAALLWIAASLGFSWYAANFASYNETYGTLGAAIGFMTWIWLSTAIVLLGAELNAEAEHQTARDSTTGAPGPMGTRGAKMADTVAP
jgi:membrane protein